MSAVRLESSGEVTDKPYGRAIPKGTWCAILDGLKVISYFLKREDWSDFNLVPLQEIIKPGTVTNAVWTRATQTT